MILAKAFLALSVLSFVFGSIHFSLLHTITSSDMVFEKKDCIQRPNLYTSDNPEGETTDMIPEPLFLECCRKAEFCNVRLGSVLLPCRMGFPEAGAPFVAFVPAIPSQVESVAVLAADYLEIDAEEGRFRDVRARILFKDGSFHTVKDAAFEFRVSRNYLDMRNKTGA